MKGNKICSPREPDWVFEIDLFISHRREKTTKRIHPHRTKYHYYDFVILGDCVI